MYNRQVNNVSPLSRELIIKLAKENDSELLREVLNYYAFLKNKKEQEVRKQWESIEEVQPDKEEIEIINEFEKNREKFEFVSMEEVQCFPTVSWLPALFYSLKRHNNLRLL